MQPLGMGLIGPGFIALHHIDAVRRLGDVKVVAVAGSSEASAAAKAAELKVEKAYGDYRRLIDDPNIHVIHNTTPNHLHFEVSKAALDAGKHIIADKPLAFNVEQAKQLRDAAAKAGVAHVVTFNYRGNALVQEARHMAADGQLGALSFIRGHYLQDWLTDDHVYSWRLDPARGGQSSAIGDIGSHWCDLAEHVSGAKITKVLADFTTVVKTRYADASTNAFSGRGESGTAIDIDSEDLATVMLRFNNGARGVFSVGQVLPGNKNNVYLEVNGREMSLGWHQERQNKLWLGHHDRANAELDKDAGLMQSEDARRYARLPGGHHEAWDDAFFNIIADAYDWIRSGASLENKPTPLPTFIDGYRNHCVVDAILKSNAAGSVWQTVNEE